MPLVGIGTLPTPFSPASVPLPPETGGRGHASLRVGGWGESQFRRGAYTYTVVLFICTYFVAEPMRRKAESKNHKQCRLCMLNQLLLYWIYWTSLIIQYLQRWAANRGQPASRQKTLLAFLWSSLSKSYKWICVHLYKCFLLYSKICVYIHVYKYKKGIINYATEGET